jgi:hypothetical protein
MSKRDERMQRKFDYALQAAGDLQPQDENDEKRKRFRDVNCDRSK